MDLDRLISELCAERMRLDAAIAALERAAGTRKRRGRPPKWLAGTRAEEGRERRAEPVQHQGEVAK
jgi:hypothetical protein